MAPDSLADAVSGARALGLAGLSVTMPHKEAIVPLLDEVVGDAVVLGAVNCVRVEGGRLIGHNTDGVGFTRGLRAETGTDAGGLRCVVLGTGGAARAVALALGGTAADVAIISRDPDRAAGVVGGLGPAVRVGGSADLAHAELVVNATPVGMAEHPGLPVDPGVLPAGTVVADLIYHPLETELVAAARAIGLRATNGVSMLVHQAAAAFKLWTGSAAPLGAIERAVGAHLTSG